MVGPVVGLPCYHSDVLSGVILKQITYTDNSTAGRHQQWDASLNHRGHDYRLGLIVYDIVAVKIFPRYCNIALSIRALIRTSNIAINMGYLVMGSWV